MKLSKPVISLVSLGCAKNEVDSEHVLGSLLQDGFIFAEDPRDADICLVNTCGFIESARDETRETLETLVARKKNGRPRFVVALGCMVERAADYPAFADVLAACDLRISFFDYPRLASLCRKLLDETAEEKPRPDILSTGPRIRIGMPHLANLKISEGCSNGCSFCSIPRMRGRQISRPSAEIIAEAVSLAENGAKEISIIAQDSTSYGKDLFGKPALAALLRELAAALPQNIWIRLMYAYPRFLSEEVLQVMAGDRRFCRYVDIPLQHVSDRILKAMGRGTNRKQIEAQLQQIRTVLAPASIRTTFITGFPGETDEEFEELLEFVREQEFNHLGAFTYSPEPLTAAAELPDDIPQKIKEARRDRLMAEQMEISHRLLQELEGQTVDVMIDQQVSKPNDLLPHDCIALGHTRQQSPDADGLVILRGKRDRKLSPGLVIPVRITTAMDYDLIARPVQ
ncbi:MAG: 30S ribosomal protein S12 methylthiotransferase RimO [Kiritimatiellia bacterium]